MRYSDAVWAHYRNPVNAGCLDAAARDVGTGEVGSADQGALMRLQIQVDGQDTIRAARFKVYGCPATIAAGSLAAERLPGCTLGEALALDSAAVVGALSLPPIKHYCAMLAEDAIRAAIQDYRQKQESP